MKILHRIKSVVIILISRLNNGFIIGIALSDVSQIYEYYIKTHARRKSNGNRQRATPGEITPMVQKVLERFQVGAKRKFYS